MRRESVATHFTPLEKRRWMSDKVKEKKGNAVHEKAKWDAVGNVPRIVHSKAIVERKRRFDVLTRMPSTNP